MLNAQGFDVTQATLSRDLRELRVAKVPHAQGESYYAVPDPDEVAPELDRLLPHLLVSADGVDHLIVVKTLAGGAQAVAEALDMEGWPELLGTIAGDDAILIIVREPSTRADVIERILRLAGR